MHISRLVWMGTLGIGVSAIAQTPPEPKYGYEVATVRKSDPAARGSRIQPGPQGGMRTSNTSLMTLLTFAYDVRDHQILEAPGWAKIDGFDVSFTPDSPEILPKPGEGTLKELEPMMDRQRQRLRAVLRDRFGLRLRQEKREMPAYNLTLAKGGSKLTASAEGNKGPSMQTNPALGELTGIGANMRMLTGVLSGLLSRPVLDRTGLDGVFDLKLKWKPDSFTGAIGPADGAVAEPEGASMFTAITEQLGLKLEPKKEAVPVYIVENVEKPGDN